MDDVSKALEMAFILFADEVPLFYQIKEMKS
jgi:hypothetical protein